MDDFRRMARSQELAEQLEEIKRLGEDDDSEDLYTRKMEEWFSRAFSFMHDLPEAVHCWCRHSNIMFALLEPFYSYFDSPLPATSLQKLWNRLSREMRRCTRCVVEHHKAKEFYAAEYGEEEVKPLMRVITVLDEQRVAEHMKELVLKFDTDSLNPTEDSVEVICILFEVLMYDFLLDDAEVNETVKPFLGHVEETHDLSFAMNQRYPGVYRLLFHSDQGVRRIAQMLAHKLPLLKDKRDMDAIQSTMDKGMSCLEFDNLDPSSTTQSYEREGPATSSGMQNCRARAVFSKDGLWIGMTTIFTLVETPALVSSVMEKYPSFISIVLNHVSEATSVFWHALRCLRSLLERLGYKFWLGTSFSPGVMRNSLLSQCFHSHEERMHVSIFDLFQPFLQSLEALQDGEYENQRRRLLYFLLHQVPKSRNFKPMMTKKARQAAFSIIGRGYSMNPPLPPVECVHVWGPPLVATLKDTGLISSLRKPATDLFEILIVADAAGLATVSHQRSLKQSFQKYKRDNGDEDGEEANQNVMEGDQSWASLASVTRTVENCEQWSCVPLIWMEVLNGIMPKDLPFSVTKGVLWALSRLSIFDFGDSGSSLGNNGAPAVVSPPSVVECPKELSAAFDWVKPKGYDDGASGEGCVNALKIEEDHCKELCKVFKNLGQNYLFLVQGAAGPGNGQEQHWIWDARIAEPCILLLLDVNATVRDFGKDVLYRIGNANTLESGLELLCSTEASAAAVIRGLRHAVSLLLFLHLKEFSRGLQQLFFYVWKMLASDGRKAERPSQISQDGGGFLSQPNFQTLTLNESSPQVNAMQKDQKAWGRFCARLASLLWPLLVRTITEGQQHWGAGQLMTWTRMLQLIPFVFQNLRAGPKRLAFSRTMDKSSWFEVLVSWGTVSSPIIERWWKEAVNSILLDLRKCGLVFPPAPEWANLMEDLQKPGQIDGSLKLQLMDRLQSVSTLAQNHEFLDNIDVTPLKADRSPGFVSKEIIDLLDDTPEHSWPSRQQIIHPADGGEKSSSPMPRNDPHASFGKRDLKVEEESVDRIEVIDLSGDSPERSRLAPHGRQVEVDPSADGISITEKYESPSPQTQAPQFRRPAIRQSSSFSSQNKSSTLDNYLLKFAHEKAQRSSQSGELRNQRTNETFRAPTPRILPSKTHHKGDTKLSALRSEHKRNLEVRSSLEGVVRSQVRERVENNASNRQEAIVEDEPTGGMVSNVPELRSEKLDSAHSTDSSVESIMLRALVQESEDDPLDLALENARKSRLVSFNDGPVKPKRKLIALEMPAGDCGGKGSTVGRARGSLLHKPRQIPRLDDWYKRILSLDYLSLVQSSDENTMSSVNAFNERLIRVPLTFSSCEHYLSVFRPLVLEEFKSQLRQSHNELSLSDGNTIGALSLMSLERVDELHVGRFMAEAGSDGAARACAENDLLLLSRQPFESKATQTCHLLAKVETRDRESKSRATVLLLKLFIPTTDNRLAKARRLLVDRSKWHMTRLMSITPQLRECQALSSLEGIPLMPTVLSPAAPGIYREKWDQGSPVDISSSLKRVPMPLQNKLKGEYNESQLRAIAAAIGGSDSNPSDHYLTLIQGPPGTGKTKTIMAILSVLLVAGRSRNGATKAGVEKESADAFKSNVRSSRQSSSTVPTSSRDAAALSRAWQDAARAKDLVKENEKLTMDSSGRKQRVLVCAQSNAAVDEIVTRICKNGLHNSEGSFLKPSVVRVGALNSIHPKSLPVYIDTLVNERLGLGKASGTEASDEQEEQKKVEACRTKLEEVIEFIHAIEALRSRSEDVGEGRIPGPKSVIGEKASKIIEMGDSAVKGKLNLLYNQRRALTAEMASAAKEVKKAYEESRNIRMAMKRDIIRQADIVVTTLSGCGGDIYSVCMESATGGGKWKKKNPDEECLFDAVVIDEAAQAIEPATLIPFQLLAQTNARCVMVGDPKQLPATVLSQAASRMQYECSMFERLQRAGYPVIMLSVQYRMHPEIREFPSLHFYDDRITDGEGMRADRKALFHREPFFGPYAFFDVVDGQECRKGSVASQSLKNDAEAAAILQLYLAFKKMYPGELRDGRLGVITPYKHQRRLLEEQFVRALGKAAAAEVEFNTVDGFQGREVDILILSTVRAQAPGTGNCNSKENIGFVADVRRMNVALTRARFSMWVIGNAATLEGNSSWSALLSNARRRSLIFRLQRPYADFFQKKQPHIREGVNPPKGLQERTRDDRWQARGLRERPVSEEADRKLHAGEEEDRRPLGNKNSSSSRGPRKDVGKAKNLPTADDDGPGDGHGQSYKRKQAGDEMGKTTNHRLRGHSRQDELLTSSDPMWLQQTANSISEKQASPAHGSWQDGQFGIKERHMEGSSHVKKFESEGCDLTDERYRKSVGGKEASENGGRKVSLKHDDHRRRTQLLGEKDERRKEHSLEEEGKKDAEGKRYNFGDEGRMSNSSRTDEERGRGRSEKDEIRNTTGVHSGTFKIQERKAQIRDHRVQSRGHQAQDLAAGVSSRSNVGNERGGSAAPREGTRKHAATQNSAPVRQIVGNAREISECGTNPRSSTREEVMTARKRGRADVKELLPPDAFASTKKPRSGAGRPPDTGLSREAHHHRAQEHFTAKGSRYIVPNGESSSFQKAPGESRPPLPHAGRARAAESATTKTSGLRKDHLSSQSKPVSDLDYILSGLSTVTQAQARMQKLDSHEKKHTSKG